MKIDSETNSNKIDLITNYLDELYPNAKCELNYSTDYSFLIAVMLSSQCTDKKVNKVTPILFTKYKNLYELKDAKYEDLFDIIYPLGLAKNKANNILKISNELIEKYDGKVPSNYNELVKLPGVGNKTANVVLLELFNVPSFPADTHVLRISKRLGLVDIKVDATKCEKELEKIFKKELWKKLHHQFIYFGRYKCFAKNPNCENCKISTFCKKSV